jgi:hypothetical protein
MGLERVATVTGEPWLSSTAHALAWLDRITIDDDADVCSRADEILYGETAD